MDDFKNLGSAGRALAVVVFDKRISTWLAENDPKALEQARRALKEEQDRPSAEVLGKENK